MNSKYPTYTWLCFLFMSLFLVLTPLCAALTGEIIFVHPISTKEIWISNVEGTNAQKLFQKTLTDIRRIQDKLSVQEKGDYVLLIGPGIDEHKVMQNNDIVFRGNSIDLHLFNRKHKFRDPKNLTLGAFKMILDADISQNGDVVFLASKEIYHIPQAQLTKSSPERVLLLTLDDTTRYIGYVEWSPNGRHIAFSSSDGLFLLDVATHNTFRITEQEAYNPMFSPNGKKIAFSTYVKKPDTGALATKAIAVVPVQPDANIEIVHIQENYSFDVDFWSPDGKYIGFSSQPNVEINNIEIFQSRGNFVIPATGGVPEPILLSMNNIVHSLDFVTDSAYAIDPEDSLVTTWGKLKEK